LAIEETARGAALTASLLDVLSSPIVQGLMSVRSESSGPFAVVFRAYEHAKFVAVLRGRFDLQIEAPGAAFAADRYVGILLVQVVRHLLYMTSCP